jgi:hypothetical protein
MRYDVETLRELMRDVLINFRLVEFYGDIGKPERPHMLAEEDRSSHQVNITVLHDPDRYSPRGFKLDGVSVSGHMGIERVTVKVPGIDRSICGILLNENVRSKLVVAGFQINLEGPPVPAALADSYLPLAEGCLYACPSKQHRAHEGLIITDAQGNKVAGSVRSGMAPSRMAAYSLRGHIPEEVDEKSAIKAMWLFDEGGVMSGAFNYPGNGIISVRFQEGGFEVFKMDHGVLTTAKEEVAPCPHLFPLS